MISRRLVRIKAMQQLYALEINPLLVPVASQKNFSHNLRNPYRAFLYMIYTLNETANYVYEFKRIEESKYLQTSQVLSLSTVLAETPFIMDLGESERLKAEFKRCDTATIVDKTLFRTLFLEFKAFPEYEAYLKIDRPTIKNDRELLRILFKKVMLPSELLDSSLEDEFITWHDDYTAAINMVMGTMNEYFKNHGEDFRGALPTINWKELDNFGHELIIKCHNHKAELDALIEPRLQNWDMDRVNLLDLLLVRMTLAELLYFPTIPVKVSLNEYVEVSKMYSSPKSREFINGILDRLMKELKEENKIIKTGRGLVD